MKVLGCKVTDKTYQQFKALDRSISDSLRDAITLYLKQVDTASNMQVNHTEIMVNHSQNKNTYQTTQKIKNHIKRQ